MGARVRGSSRGLAAVGVAVATIALVVAVVNQTTPLPLPTGSPSARPTTSAATPVPSTPLGEWGEIPSVASLAASAGDAAGIAPDARFVLTSLASEPVERLAERLSAQPALSFAVSADAAGRTATLTPSEPLARGTDYHFALRAADGSLAGSWAFHIRGPVDVVRTVPGDATTDVPLDTGIEITFDQDDVADMASHFRIEPAVDGRFERAGRSQVFIPAGLRPATLYTVTISAGLGRTGAQVALEQDVVIRFETRGSGSDAVRVIFGRDALEVSPEETPIVAVEAIRRDDPDDTQPELPARIPVAVYRFASVDAGSVALATFLAAPRWTTFTDPLIPTDGLAVAARFDARPEATGDGQALIRFPEPLQPGLYVVELAGERPAHAFLQITPVAAWVAAATDRTVVWVNDVTEHRSVTDAVVMLEGGATLGTSDAEGLMIAPTPQALVPTLSADRKGATVSTGPRPILRVTSPAAGTVLVPFDVAGYGGAYRGEWWEKTAPADETYWSMLFTDRGIYRQDDRIAVSGYLRDRDDGTVPASVVVSLARVDGSAAPAIVAQEVTPAADGTFAADLAFTGLPLGDYDVQAVVAGRVVVSSWIEVTIIRKPAYALSLVPDHTAVITGSRVTWTAAATFFEGSPVPGLPVDAMSDLFEDTRSATTDAFGVATFRLQVRADPDEEGATDRNLSISPRGPETSEITASSDVVVFPSAYQVRGTGSVVDGRLLVRGTLRAVDLEHVERLIAQGRWDGEAPGTGVAAGRIDASIIELIPVRRQVGTDYDWIEKVVRPRYEYEIQRHPVATVTVTTGSDGTFTLRRAVPDPDHEYEIVLTARDAAGRIDRRSIHAGRPFEEVDDRAVMFVRGDGSMAGEGERYGVGDAVRWRMMAGDRRFPTGDPDRYLYVISQRGLRSADVSTEPVFAHTFAAADAPGIFVMGVRFTGTTYAPKAAAWADFDAQERTITVSVTADRARYQPGETARLTIRTTDRTGRPVPAAVILQGVDEKLYAMDGASTPQPLEALYQRVDSGIVRLTATHQLPSRPGPEGEGGDTTGGDERSDFRDTLVYRRLETDASGAVTTTVDLSDDLTSWRMSAVALTADLQAGVAEASLPVGLPFFVEATVADSYLVEDQPIVRFRTYGDDLRAGTRVSFEISSQTLGIHPTTVTGRAFEPVSFPLPELRLGRQQLRVAATATGGSAVATTKLTDRLVVTFDVVASRFTDVRTRSGVVGDELPTLQGATGFTTYTFTDAGRGRVVPLLVSLAEGGGARYDRLAAAVSARTLLIEAFGRDPASLPPVSLDPSLYPVSEGDPDVPSELIGIGLLPWSSPDPWLAVRIAIDAPERGPRSQLPELLHAILDDPRTQRDLAYGALAGLANLGEPVLADLQRAAAETDLTVDEQLLLAAGLVAAGDHPGAVALERALLEGHGERVDAWVRHRIPDDPDATSTATVRLAAIAAAVGDPLAPQMADYVVANPAGETVPDLELLSYSRQLLARAPSSSASFAWTVDGDRTTVDLDPGESWSVSLTPAQQATLRLEVLTGAVTVVLQGRSVVDPSDVETHPDIQIRRVTPLEGVAGAGFVEVELEATFRGLAPMGSYDVTELVPTGLAPVENAWVGPDDDGIAWPIEVVGQEVRFSVARDPKGPDTVRLRYRARVVNEGTYVWEPAALHYTSAPSIVALTPPISVAVGEAG
jgi:hypothetical protein